MILRKAMEKDLQLIKPAPDDLAEAAAFGITPSFPNVTDCLTIELDGKPLAIGGNILNCVWFVTSEDINKLSHKDIKMFIKLITTYRNCLLELYPVLYNVIWSGNKSHIKFLKHIGAEFHTINNKFLLFTIEENTNV